MNPLAEREMENKYAFPWRRRFGWKSQFVQVEDLEEFLR